MLDLRKINVRNLEREGLAAVLLLRLRERIQEPEQFRGEASAWMWIVDSELSARWDGLYADPKSGRVKTPAGVNGMWSKQQPELEKRAREAMEFLRQRGLVQQDPRQTHSREYVVPTEEGSSIRIDTEPPLLALPREADWIHKRYGPGVLHITGSTETGDESGGAVFWLRQRCFATCAHNVTDLKEWSIHHHDLRLTQEHLAPVQHPNEQCDIVILRPKTRAVDLLEIPPLPMWHESVEPGERGFAMGYPAISRRNAVLVICPATCVSTEGYADGLSYVTLAEEALEGGYSGGPLFNSRGYVVGVICQQTGDASQGGRGHGHALPVAYVEEVLAQGE